MASEPDSAEISSLFDRLLRNSDMSLFLPFILGFANTSRREENSENRDDREQQTERIILINPFTQGMVVIEGSSNLESLLRNLSVKDGQPPASKASMEAMPSFEIGEDAESSVGECVVCLEEYERGVVVKEMPCKHRFHDKCIEKWLGIHGSCPVCRYKMPVDEDTGDQKRDREQRREIWVSFSINGRRTGGSESDPTETTQNSTQSAARDRDEDASAPNSEHHQDQDQA